mmetsp:Transcript_26775/g.43507  ORF Transcript_26775/g.43507 Transcript_26775/m.43507 type:complete len:220 (+) Transcript_26775:87-746(+)
MSVNSLSNGSSPSLLFRSRGVSDEGLCCRGGAKRFSKNESISFSSDIKVASCELNDDDGEKASSYPTFHSLRRRSRVSIISFSSSSSFGCAAQCESASTRHCARTCRRQGSRRRVRQGGSSPAIIGPPLPPPKRKESMVMALARRWCADAVVAYDDGNDDRGIKMTCCPETTTGLSNAARAVCFQEDMGMMVRAISLCFLRRSDLLNRRVFPSTRWLLR